MKTSSSTLRRLPSALILPALALCALLFTTSARAADTAPAALPEVDHWVYLAELPDPAELSQNAAANGLTVQRIDHKADTLVITYKYPDGVVGTMGYKLLSAVNKGDVTVYRAPSTVDRPSTTTVVERTVIEREPEIVYVDRTPRTRVVYRERDDFWLPLTVGLGIGYITGHNSHGHHGHWRGHYSSHRSYRGHHGRR